MFTYGVHFGVHFSVTTRLHSGKPPLRGVTASLGPSSATLGGHDEAAQQKTTTWNAMAEVFSDDLNLNIGDLLLNPLYHATRKPRARLFMLMHVCARASSKLRASLTSAPIVASDLFSNPLSYISKVARQSGRAASAGGHHGGPRRATRRSHADSPACCPAPFAACLPNPLL